MNVFPLLSRLHEDIEMLLPRLMAQLENEPNGETQREMVFDIGSVFQFMDENAKTHIFQILESLFEKNKANLIGVGATVSLFKLLKEDTPSEYLDYAVYVIQNIDDYVVEDWWVHTDILTILCEIVSYIDMERRVSTLTVMIQHTDEITIQEWDNYSKYLFLCQYLLETVFKRTVPESLTNQQKIVLKAILETGLAWEAIVDNRVFWNKFPNSRAEIVKLLQS